MNDDECKQEDERRQEDDRRQGGERRQGDEGKQKKDLIIPRNALFGIAPAVAITAVLLAKNKPGEVLLLFIGIAAGVIIARAYLKK
jgi:hypothetical protein